jgi:electron transport complex protein RnfD
MGKINEGRFMEESKLVVSASPHIRYKDSIPKIMWTMVLSLLPAVISSIYFFGPRSLLLILISVITAVGTEAIIQKLLHKKITISDGSAVITGMLLAMVIPPGVPLWMPAVGSFCSIAIAKSVFGGLGYNIFNPALIGRAILLGSFPVAMTTWTFPAAMGHLDSTTAATALVLEKSKLVELVPSVWDLFLGIKGGSLGETSILALLIGAAVLLLRGYITWHIPVSFIGTVAVIIGLEQAFGDRNFVLIPLHLLSGGLVLGAFFMATDMVTSPLTKKGGLIFGIGAGVITCLIRLLGGYPEGVCYAILLMNALTPLIDRYIKPKRFGT